MNNSKEGIDVGNIVDVIRSGDETGFVSNSIFTLERIAVTFGIENGHVIMRRVLTAVESIPPVPLKLPRRFRQ